jgi:hypothetical protein
MDELVSQGVEMAMVWIQINFRDKDFMGIGV